MHNLAGLVLENLDQAPDAVALGAAGYDAVLVGEHLVTSGDPAAAVADLRVPRVAVEAPRSGNSPQVG